MLKSAVYIEMISFLAIILVLISITVADASEGKD